MPFLFNHKLLRILAIMVIIRSLYMLHHNLFNPLSLTGHLSFSQWLAKTEFMVKDMTNVKSNLAHPKVTLPPL